MSEPRLIGVIMRELNMRILSGEPVHVDGFVYFMTSHGVMVFTETEYNRLKDGDDSDSDK